MKNYYFTMGVGDTSETGMPFKGGHVLVKAETLGDARRKYMAKYPHPRCPETVGNYSFDYTDANWKPIGGMEVCHDTIE